MKREKSSLVAMSGGVDSSVALYFSIKKYINTIGATMKLFANKSEQAKNKSCCSVDDVYDAKKVAGIFNVPHYTLDYKKEFKEYVINKFINEYEKGFTPNPCVDCNKYLKYKFLLNDLEKFDKDILVTGHYAKNIFNKKQGVYELKKSVDEIKDQSYFLYMLNQSNLSKIDFPLGEFKKDEIREIAAELNYINKSKKDSQDICFVENGDYFSFIKNETKKDYKKGKILNKNLCELGECESIIKFTIGQRKGIRISSSEPLYVVDKNVKENYIVVGNKNELLKDSFLMNDVNIISGEKLDPNKDYFGEVKVRYNSKQMPCKYFLEGDNIRVVLKEKVSGIAKGQAGVIYEESLTVGGGTIISC